MIITKIEPVKLRYYPQKPLRDGLARIPSRDVFLLKIETDEEIYGIGEGFALGCLDSVAAYTLECLAPLLIGSNPLEITRLWNRIYQQTFRFGKRGIGIAALSAVDIALWDILGKKAGLPVCSLLGKDHDCIYPYASAGYYAPGKTIEDLRKEAAGYKAQGFRMMKMKVGGAQPGEDMERVAAVREVLGTDVKLAVDANNSWDYETALKMARFFETQDVYFLEEPLSSDFWEESAKLAAEVDIPIAGYETELTLHGLKPFIVHNGVDIVQTDVIWTGGISEARRIAMLAEAWGKMTVMHFSASMVSLAANLQLALSMNSSKYIEYTLDENPLRDRLSKAPVLMKDGVVKVPDLPGIGVDLDWDVVKEFQVQ